MKLKLILVIAYLCTGSIAFTARISDLTSASLALFLALFGGLSLLFLMAATVKNTALRWAYAGVFFVAALFANSFSRITGHELTYSEFITMVESVGSVDEALSQHLWNVVTAASGSLLLMLGIGLPPSKNFQLFGRTNSISPALGVLMLMVMLFFRGGDGAKALPAPFTTLAYAGLLSYESITTVRGPRIAVNLHRNQNQLEHIVLIVDESVSANYLDLNNDLGIKTGLKTAPPNISLYNYGYAASATNCSAGSNVTLRYGGTRDHYPEMIATMPSIWAYAKKAGMKSVFIDAQRTGGNLQNLMSAQELSLIDQFIQFDEVLVRDRDMAAADEISKILSRKEPHFIYVNKVGAHFPVHDKYPDSYMKYQPILARGGHESVTDTGDRTGFDGSTKEWQLYRNSYRNTLLWNVGAFFERLFSKTNLSKTTLIYTSDHGQDLHERGNPGNSTHCSESAEIQEGLVPMVVMHGRRSAMFNWNDNAAANKNKSSHYNIFPTLLLLMGYDAKSVQTTYGASLIESLNDPMTFNTRFNARLGQAPVWTKIDTGKIISPPEDGSTNSK